MEPGAWFAADRPLPARRAPGFEDLLGLELTELSAEVATGRIPVRDELKQLFGPLHGGVYAAIAETLASWGTAQAVFGEGKLAMGLSNQTSFLRPITAGTIHAHACSRHRGRTTWVWEVEITDDDGHLCALTRMTVAVRER